jgi:hypothetical protein
MSGAAGFTATPIVITNPDGSESISYDDAHIEDNSWRQNAVEYSNDHQEDWIYTNSHDEAFHEAFSPNSFEGQDFENPGELWADEDVAEAVNHVGGAAEYARMQDWAIESLGDEWVDQFNNIMDSGDPGDIYNALEVLSNLYNNGEKHDEDIEEYEDEQLGLEIDEVLEMAASLQNENPIASQAFSYLAAALNEEITLEEAVGYLADDWGYEDAVAIMQEIIQQNT